MNHDPCADWLLFFDRQSEFDHGPIANAQQVFGCSPSAWFLPIVAEDALVATRGGVDFTRTVASVIESGEVDRWRAWQRYLDQLDRRAGKQPPGWLSRWLAAEERGSAFFSSVDDEENQPLGRDEVQAGGTSGAAGEEEIEEEQSGLLRHME